MKISTVFFEKIYWLCVAVTPLLPLIVLRMYYSASVCTDGEICFEYGHSVLNNEGEIIVVLATTLLWPNCAWNLIGKQVWEWIRSANKIEGVK